MNLAHSSSQSDFSSSRFLCSFMQALCGTVKMNTKFSWIGMEVAFLATFAFWSFFVLYCCCFAWGGVPCFKIWWNNKTVSWILTAEGQHTTSVHLCVVWLSAAMLSKNTEHRQHLSCCYFVCMRFCLVERRCWGTVVHWPMVAVLCVGELVKEMLLYHSAFKASRETFLFMVHLKYSALFGKLQSPISQ